MRLLVILAILCAGCGQAAAPPGAVQDSAARLLTTDMRTVLVGEDAQALRRQCSRPSPRPASETWTPNAAQLDALEVPLTSLLAGRLADAHSSASPGDYYRQYAGFIIGGRRVIYVNGVEASAIEREPDPAHSFDWRRQAVSICDGGSIAFGVEYDVETGRFSNFAFNGRI